MVEVFQSGAANFQTFKTENALVNYGVINYGFSFHNGSEDEAIEKHNSMSLMSDERALQLASSSEGRGQEFLVVTSMCKDGPNKGSYQPVATLVAGNRTELAMGAIASDSSVEICEMFRSITDLRDFVYAYSYASEHLDNGCNHRYLSSEFYRHFGKGFDIHTLFPIVAMKNFLKKYHGRYAEVLNSLVNNYDDYVRGDV